MKESFWRKTIQRQLESGLTQAGFCRKEGVSKEDSDRAQMYAAQGEKSAADSQWKKALDQYLTAIRINPNEARYYFWTSSVSVGRTGHR